MIQRIFFYFKKKEAGFTLLEVIVSLAITSFIALGAAVSSAQILTQTNRNSNYNTASRNAMNAIYWVGRDAQMAQVFADTSGFPLTDNLSMAWEDWNSVSYNVTYSLVDGKFFRTYAVDGDSTTTLIADYINSSENMTRCTSENGTLVFTITSSVGRGSQVVDVTRVREITARPQL